MVTSVVVKWLRCTLCGYRHAGSAPKEKAKEKVMGVALMQGSCNIDSAWRWSPNTGILPCCKFGDRPTLLYSS